MTALSRRAVFAAAAACWLAAPAAAAPVPGDTPKAGPLPFPAEAPVVVQVNGVERVKGRVAAMLRTALPDLADKLARQIDAGVDAALDGRQLTAVPADGRVYLVLHDFARLADEAPAVSVLVPVTDYAKFRDTFLTAAERKTFKKGAAGVDTLTMTLGANEKELFAAAFGGYVALSPDEETAKEYAGKFERATAAALGAGVGESFLAGDAAVYVNMDAVNAKYGAQIQGFKGLIDFAFQQGGAQGQGVGKKQMEAAKAGIKGLFQGVEDCRGLALGVEFRPDGFNFRLHGRFADDTPTGRVLADERPTAQAGLGDLPRGQMTYTGTFVGKGVRAMLQSFAQEYGAAEDDEKGQEAMKKLAAGLAAAGESGQYAAASIPVAGIQVSEFKDPTKAVAAMQGMLRGLAEGGTFQNVMLKEKPTVKVDAQKHAGFTLTEVKMSLDLEAALKDLPEGAREAAEASMKRMMKEKMTFWFGTDGKRYVQINADNWAAAEKLLDGYVGGKDKVSALPGFAVTRKNLPAETSVLGLVEVGQTIAMIGDFMKTMKGQVPNFPADFPDLKAPKGDPAFLGTAITLQPGSARFDFFVPAAAIGIGRQVVEPLMKKVD